MARKSKLTPILHKVVISHLEDIPFIILLSFLITFSTTRVYLYLADRDILELPQATYINGVHIHHLSWGIFLLSLTGFLALYDLKPSNHKILAVIYGIGLGLTFDEFSMWLNLKDNYSSRISHDAIIIITLILLNIVYFPGFWTKLSLLIRHRFHLLS